MCGDFDTQLFLYTVDPVTGDLDLFASNDDFTGLCSRLDLAMDPGLHVLQVDGFAGDAVDAYTLIVEDYVETAGDGLYAGGFTTDHADHFRFVVEGRLAFSAETDDGAGGCPGDTYMELFRLGEVRESVGADDDSGPGFCSALGLILDPGTYELDVTGSGGAAIDDYFVDLMFADPGCGDGILSDGEECDDANTDDHDGCSAVCTVDTALGTTGEYSAGFGEDAYDVFTFSVGHDPTNVFFETVGEGCDAAAIDTVIEIFRLDGEDGPVSVSADDDGGRSFCSVLSLELGPGSYALHVRGFGGSAVDDVTLVYDAWIDATGGGDFAGGFPAGSSNLFRFSVDAASIAVVLETSDGAGGCPGDTFLTLSSIDGEGVRSVVGTNDDSGTGLCSFLESTIGIGDYEVEVRGFGGVGIGSYVISVGFAAP